MKRDRGLKMLTVVVLTSATVSSVHARNQMTTRPPPPPPPLLPLHQHQTAIRPPPPPPLKATKEDEVKEAGQSLKMPQSKIIPPPPPMKTGGVLRNDEEEPALANRPSSKEAEMNGPTKEDANSKVEHATDEVETDSFPKHDEGKNEGGGIVEVMSEPRNNISAPEEGSLKVPPAISTPIAREPLTRDKIRPPPPKVPPTHDRDGAVVRIETSDEIVHPRKHDEKEAFAQDSRGQHSALTEEARVMVQSETRLRPTPPPPVRQTQQSLPDKPRSVYSTQPVQRHVHQTSDRPLPQQIPRRPVVSGTHPGLLRQHPAGQAQAHRRLPPQQVQNQYAYRRKQQQQAPAWRRVWQNIERGLDGLADLEDAIAGRAQQVYEAATSSVKLPGWQASSSNRGNDDLPAQSMVSEFQQRVPRKKEVAKVPPQQMDMSRFRKSVVEPQKGGQEGTPPQKESAATTSTHPYGSSVKESSGLTSHSKDISSSATVTLRKIDWSDVVSGKTTKMIRANGGASVPRDDGRQRPQGPVNPSWMNVDSKQVTQPPVTAQRKHAFPENQWSGTTSPRAPTPPLSFSEDKSNRRFPDEDESSLMDRMKDALPSFPNLRSFRLNPFHKSSFHDYSSVTMDAWKLDEADEPKLFLGIFRRRGPSTNQVEEPSHHGRPEESNMPPLSSLMRRSESGKSTLLLSAQDKLKISSIAKQRAMFDFLSLSLILVGSRSLPDISGVAIPRSLSDLLSNTMPWLSSNLGNVGETWAPIAFAAAFLALKTGHLVCEPKLQNLSLDVANAVSQESQYGSLFLRLVSSQLPRRDVVDKMLSAAYLQVSSHYALTRLKAFVACLALTLMWMTFAVLRPFLDAASHVMLGIFTLDVWRTWPPNLASASSEVFNVFSTFGAHAIALMKQEAGIIANNPLRFAYETSIFLVLLAVVYLAEFESKRVVPENNVHFEEDAVELHQELTERIVDMGTSSATRLQLYSEPGGVESMLERWRLARPDVAFPGNGIQLRSLLRRGFYGLTSCILLAAPALVYVLVGISPLGSPQTNVIRWDSLFDVGVVLAITHLMVWSTVSCVMESSIATSRVKGFLSALAEAVDNRKKSTEGTPTPMRMHSSVSPTSGLLVRDLWAAHTTRRAWAVRGATFECKNGEVLVILGDEGSGKTKLLTTVAEALLDPPKQAQTATRVRGAIFAGGEEANKWEKAKLQRRLGIFLSDVRSAADEAKVFSGLSVEEILEPSTAFRYSDATHTVGTNEKAAIILSLKVTGLYSTLMPRLPSKLSTVVTAKEDELVPSPLRPRSYLLSPSEWSKLLIARVIAQTIHENENGAKKSDQIDAVLVGSYLLLDDATALFSEIEESRFLKDLRRTGAATILTSSRWAIGRFADKIAVVKEGAVVEYGTHSELLSRGPQHSIYAAKWYAMTSQ